MRMQLNQVNHVGASVRDLDRSIEFYRELTGGKLQFVNDMYGPGLASVTGDENVRVRFCWLKLGNTVLELIEWQQPQGADNTRTGSDVGSIHIAFEVSDIHADYERLRAKGIEFLAPPHTFADEDGSPGLKGATFAYITDPDGIGLELFQPAKT